MMIVEIAGACIAALVSWRIVQRIQRRERAERTERLRRQIGKRP